MNRSQRRYLVRKAHDLMVKRWPQTKSAPGHCLYAAISVCFLLKKHHNIRAIIQAGTAYWRRVPPHLDDGVMDTHFGFHWRDRSDEEIAQMHLITQVQGQLPEIHCWAGIPGENEIVDITTRTFPTQARLVQDVPWPGKKPPWYLWCKANELPEEACYLPSLSACKLAHRCAQDLLSLT